MDQRQRRRRPARPRARAVAAAEAEAPELPLHPQHEVVRRPERGPGPVPERAPVFLEIYKHTWDGGNGNRDGVIPGPKFLPLPTGAAVVEATYFVFLREYRTGDELTDVELKTIYRIDFNDVGDKRREALYYHELSKNPQDAKKYKAVLARLLVELKSLMTKLQRKIDTLLEDANMIVYLPDHFNTPPV